MLINERYSVYSMADTSVVINHPDVGQFTLTKEVNGGGQIVVRYNMDSSSHTNTASGYTIINKTVSRSGVVTFEVAQNSNNDRFLQTFIDKTDKLTPASKFADATIDITDACSGLSLHILGVTIQKRPDRTYGQQAGTLQYAFLCADIQQNGGFLSDDEMFNG